MARWLGWFLLWVLAEVMGLCCTDWDFKHYNDDVLMLCKIPNERLTWEWQVCITYLTLYLSRAYPSWMEWLVDAPLLFKFSVSGWVHIIECRACQVSEWCGHCKENINGWICSIKRGSTENSIWEQQLFSQNSPRLKKRRSNNKWRSSSGWNTDNT